MEEKTIQDYWMEGHVAFQADEDEQEYHSDVWFFIDDLIQNGSRQNIEEIHNWLFFILLEGDPEVLIEDDYNRYSWLVPVIPRLEKALTHPVRLLKFSEFNVQNLEELRGKYPGKAVLFNPVVSLGEDLVVLLDMARHCGSEPRGIVTLVDRSTSGIYAWEDLHLAAMMRRPTNIWKPQECPLCRLGEPFVAVGLSRG